MRLTLLAVIAVLAGCAGQGPTPATTAAMPEFAIHEAQKVVERRRVNVMVHAS